MSRTEVAGREFLLQCHFDRREAILEALLGLIGSCDIANRNPGKLRLKGTLLELPQESSIAVVGNCRKICAEAVLVQRLGISNRDVCRVLRQSNIPSVSLNQSNVVNSWLVFNYGGKKNR